MVSITEAMLPPEGKTQADRYNSELTGASQRGLFVAARGTSEQSALKRGL